MFNSDDFNSSFRPKPMFPMGDITPRTAAPKIDMDRVDRIKADLKAAYSAVNASVDAQKIVDTLVVKAMVGAVLNIESMTINASADAAKAIDEAVRDALKAMGTSHDSAAEVARKSAREQLLRDILCDIGERASDHDIDPQKVWNERFE